MLNIVKNFRYTGLIISLFVLVSVVLLGQNILVSSVSAQKAETQKLPNPNPDKSIEYSLQNGNIGLFNNAFNGTVQNENRLITPVQIENPAGISYKSISGNPLTTVGGTGPGRSKFDFDGDGKTDISVFSPSTNEWRILRSSDNQIDTAQTQFEGNTITLVPADSDGDGTTEVSGLSDKDVSDNIASPGDTVSPDNNARRFIVRFRVAFRPLRLVIYYEIVGKVTIRRVATINDYDGDRKADLSFFEPSNSTWFIYRSSDQQLTTTQFGLPTDKPVPADYDGDGKADIAIFRPSNGSWWIRRSSDGGIYALAFGASTDIPVVADYTGDGKADVAVFRPSNGQWYILRSENNSYYGFQFGTSGDVPVPGDYDGDGKTDAAVYRPTSSAWYILRSTGGVQATQFGAANDIPVPSVYIPLSTTAGN